MMIKLSHHHGTAVPEARIHEVVKGKEAEGGGYVVKFADGATELTELVQGLNDHGSTAPDGSAWTEETFQTEMKKLGA